MRPQLHIISSLAIFAAMRRVSSWLSNLAAERVPHRLTYQIYFVASAITIAERITNGAICIQKTTTLFVI
jgi:hypothetical protein